jgi:hypothetical protein
MRKMALIITALLLGGSLFSSSNADEPKFKQERHLKKMEWGEQVFGEVVTFTARVVASSPLTLQTNFVTFRNSLLEVEGAPSYPEGTLLKCKAFGTTITCKPLKGGER